MFLPSVLGDPVRFALAAEVTEPLGVVPAWKLSHDWGDAATRWWRCELLSTREQEDAPKAALKTMKTQNAKLAERGRAELGVPE